MSTPPSSEELKRKLTERAAETESGCWEWTGTRREETGYGRLWLVDRHYTASRLVAVAWHGLDYFDRSLQACHSCDNPPCVNPDHIYIGTPLDNMGDKVARNRWRPSTRPRATLYPRLRSCDICGTEYEPNVDHRGRSKVCSPRCLSELRRRVGVARPHKLRPDDVRAIRGALSSGARGIDVARQFGISKAQVSLIKSGKAWRDVA